MSGLNDAAVVDIHAHVVLEQTMGAAGAHGPELGQTADGSPRFRVGDYVLEGVRYAGSAFMDLDVRLRQMEVAGIDFQVLSPNPLTYFHFVEPSAAIAFCRRHNEVVASLVRAQPQRVGAFAALPLQNVGAACEELERAVGELGLLGGYVGTDTVRPLHDPAMDRLYQRCVDLDVPLFLHPAPAGIDGPPGDRNLRNFDLDVVIGFAAQEAIAVASLIFGGVLDRHPRLDLCLSHGGGATPFLIGRMALAGRKRPWAPEFLRADGAFEERFARLWLDTHLNSERSLELLKSLVGEERLVYGTNFAGWDAPQTLSGQRPPRVYADNARRLLRASRDGG